MSITTFGFEAKYASSLLNMRAPEGLLYKFSRTRASNSDLKFETSRDIRLFKVEPFDGDSWVGEFEGGAEGLSGVFATPSPDSICIVVKGQGFLVPMLYPEEFEIIK